MDYDKKCNTVIFCFRVVSKKFLELRNTRLSTLEITWRLMLLSAGRRLSGEPVSLFLNSEARRKVAMKRVMKMMMTFVN